MDRKSKDGAVEESAPLVISEVVKQTESSGLPSILRVFDLCSNDLPIMIHLNYQVIVSKSSHDSDILILIRSNNCSL